ncbi:MAG: hypothetical protein HQ481_01225 [Alphaproteobacteria bacterium]|nr:hypothetical protein [Alphaproteobacteria bacterium]
MNEADTLGDWDPYPETETRNRPANVNTGAPAIRGRADAVTPLKTDRLHPVEEIVTRPAPAIAPAAKPAMRPKAKAHPSRNAAKASWLGEARTGGRVNAAQFVRELERFQVDETKRAVADAVMEVNPSEVEGVARLAARIKGRYLAKLLDLGNPSKTDVKEAEIAELTRHRETYEELSRGLDMLKAAIEAGDLPIAGMVRR